MTMNVNGDLADLVMARRLMLRTERLNRQQAGETVKDESIQDELEEDQALLSGAGRTSAAEARPQQTGDDVRVSLTDLIASFKQVQSQSVTVEDGAGNRVEVAESSSVEVNVEYHAWQRVEGLVRRNQRVAETDRYYFEFQDGSTFKITDKWSGKSTTIWGDPHVDTSDQDGAVNGEFSDLKSSDSHTTLVLQDGTRLTFTARDNGIIEQVDLIKGEQHLRGIGGASQQYSDANSLFVCDVRNDGSAARSVVPVGDTLYAGGDGNDWLDASGRMVWGKTTGLAPVGRPLTSLEITVRRTYEQTIKVVPVGVQA